MIRWKAHILRTLGMLALLLASFPAQYRHFHQESDHDHAVSHTLPGAETVQEDCDLCDIPVLADRLVSFQTPQQYLRSIPLQPAPLQLSLAFDVIPCCQGRAPPAHS